MKYLLIKRGDYWRPNASGYTYFKEEAGRYSHDEAASYCHQGSYGEEPVSMVSESEADLFSPSCNDRIKLKYLLEKYEDSLKIGLPR